MRAVSFGAVFCFLLLTISCVKDRCKDTVCNNGVCVEGYCSCLNGYEGEHCEEVWNARFPANWEVTETTQGSTLQVSYSITTIVAMAPDEFLVMDLHDGQLDSIVCKRTSYNKFSMIQRNVTDSSFYLMSGSGTLDSSENTVSGFYILREADTTIRHNMTWSK